MFFPTKYPNFLGKVGLPETYDFLGLKGVKMQYMIAGFRIPL